MAFDQQLVMDVAEAVEKVLLKHGETPNTVKVGIHLVRCTGEVEGEMERCEAQYFATMPTEISKIVMKEQLRQFRVACKFSTDGEVEYHN